MVLLVPSENRLYFAYKHAGHWCGVDEQPDWVSIYFNKNSESRHQCNICEIILLVGEKSPELLDHIKNNHREIHDLHKDNPEATVGFRIEFLHLNVLKDDDDSKKQPVILGEVSEETTEEIVPLETVETEIEPIAIDGDDQRMDQPIALMPKKKRTKVKRDKYELSADNRRRSWVWKYFNRMSNIIFRCNLCNVVLSIKGCNTNNMNRHVRTRHPNIYRNETLKKVLDRADLDMTEVETPIAVKTEVICSDKELEDSNSVSKHRRSWIWMYFDRTSATTAQCKICQRNITHGGNATGNMNRHLKMIHHKTGDDYSWVWKVFEESEEDFYLCKICQFRCMKFVDVEKSVTCILHHLKEEHGVVSGDQIITGHDEEEGLLG